MVHGITQEILAEFEKIIDDESAPKNIKLKITELISMFEDAETTPECKNNRALQELDEISEEANIPEHIRTHIWGIVSLLESA